MDEEPVRYDESLREDGPFGTTAKTFFELGSSQRPGILFKVAEGKRNLASLSEDLDSTMPEVRRHIIRLIENRMLQRYRGGMCSFLPHLARQYCKEKSRYISIDLRAQCKSQ
jgi:hypothetical protein